MELFREIRREYLREKSRKHRKMRAEAMVGKVCYRALCEIKKIVEDETLSDKECFYRVEAIVRVLERIGSNGGFRHDFG